MYYINPYNLLEIKSDNLSDVDANTIKKAKRKLFSEMELSDAGTLLHNGFELTKSDCIKVIEDLDNKDKREFHFFISQNKPLNNFLTYGNLTFFQRFKTESIYKLPEFLDFVSPFFSIQYERVLVENFKNNNLENVKTILSLKPITNDAYFEKCYKSTYALIRDINIKIERINKDIENESSPYISQNFKGLPQTISKKVKIPVLNVLPIYFQSIRNQLAETINRISTTVNNKPYNNYETAFEIVELAKNISTDGLAHQKITKDYYIVKENFDSIHTNSSISTDSNIQINEEQEEKKEEKNEKKKDHVYSIFIISGLVIGFFYRPLHFVILSIQLITLITVLIYGVNNNSKQEFSIKVFLKNSMVIIVGSILGFFYSFIARIFIGYWALSFLSLFISELFPNKKRIELKPYIYIIISILLTFSYQNYLPSKIYDFAINKSEFVKVKDIAKKSPEEYYKKGLKLGESGDILNAIKAFNKAIKLDPSYFNAYLKSAFYKIRIEDYQGAIYDCNKADSLNAFNADVYNHRGYAKYRLKQLDEALIDFNKAIGINPQYANAYRNRGEIKYDRNDNKGAVKDYSLAIQYDPENSSYHFARGLAYYYLNDYKKAIEDMGNAIQLNPNKGQYYYDRGDAKEKINNISGACSDWKIANEKGYSVPEYKLNMCIPKVILMENGNISGCKCSAIYASPKIDNSLKVKVENTDVAIKLINTGTGKCMRFVFINQNTTYTLTNIPEGRYFLKIAYGEDWAKTTRESNCQGRFTKNTIFKKSNNIMDFNIIETDDGWQIPYFELGLRIEITERNVDDFSQFNSSNITENDFYND